MFKKLLPIFIATFIITACSFTGYMKEDAADRLAAPAWMLKREIAANPFLLTAYERMHQRHAPARVYIEGDGKAYVSKSQFSLNPTPSYPLALHLAAKDNADNVVYLSRPCQYSGMLSEEESCSKDYWTNKRYAPEVINSFGKALDDIKYRYDINEFELVGFSGGGTVALLLAAQRSDIKSVRTVAGNLDHVAHSEVHEVSVLDGSLNPPDFANVLKNVPQRHFVGGMDEVVPWGVIHSYLSKIGDTNCVSYSFIQEAEHMDGWVEKWPELLREEVACKGSPREVIFRPIPYEPKPYTPRIGATKKVRVE